MPTASEDQKFDLISNALFTPVIGDILDALGCCHQFLPQPIQPMTLKMKIVGRALPVHIADA